VDAAVVVERDRAVFVAALHQQLDAPQEITQYSTPVGACREFVGGERPPPHFFFDFTYP